MASYSAYFRLQRIINLISSRCKTKPNFSPNHSALSKIENWKISLFGIEGKISVQSIIIFITYFEIKIPSKRLHFLKNDEIKSKDIFSDIFSKFPS